MRGYTGERPRPKPFWPRSTSDTTRNGSKLGALDKKAEVLDKEFVLLLFKVDTYKKALDFLLTGAEISRELASPKQATTTTT